MIDVSERGVMFRYSQNYHVDADTCREDLAVVLYAPTQFRYLSD